MPAKTDPNSPRADRLASCLDNALMKITDARECCFGTETSATDARRAFELVSTALGYLDHAFRHAAELREETGG